MSFSFKAFVFHIQWTKVYVYHGTFSANFLKDLQSGDNFTETATVYRYPTNGFDLSDATQRKDLYMTMFNVFKYSISEQAKLNFLTSKVKVPLLPSSTDFRILQSKKSS
jgi:hypothetical protein